jgi:hypothetical protein
VENLTFFLEVNDFRTLEDERVHVITTRAIAIWERYLAHRAPCAVNLPGDVVRRVKAVLSTHLKTRQQQPGDMDEYAGLTDEEKAALPAISAFHSARLVLLTLHCPRVLLCDISLLYHDAL